MLTVSILNGKTYLKVSHTIFLLIFGMGFALIALSFNLQNNGVTQSPGTPISNNNILLERFIFRIIANGDTSYLTLPNEVIEKLSTDSIFARFISHIIGTGNLSNILGYQVADFSLGRQALLYYDPENSISGGPTSQFDLFGYLYFGQVGGLLFCIFIGMILGGINQLVRYQQKLEDKNPPHRIAFIATLWTRSVQIILEPAIGVAYILDCILIFASIFGLVGFVKNRNKLL